MTQAKSATIPKYEQRPRLPGQYFEKVLIYRRCEKAYPHQNHGARKNCSGANDVSRHCIGDGGCGLA